MIVLGLLALSLAQPADSGRVAARRPHPDSLPPDRWLGEDKIKHAFVSGTVYALSFAAVRLAGADRRAGLAIAAVPTALVGVGKEVRDRRVTGRFSVRDLVADAVGATVYGLVLARTTK